MAVEILLSLRMLAQRPSRVYALWHARTVARLGMPPGEASPASMLGETLGEVSSTPDAVHLIAGMLGPWHQAARVEPDAPVRVPEPRAGDTGQPRPGDPVESHPGDPGQPRPGDPDRLRLGDPGQPRPGDPAGGGARPVPGLLRYHWAAIAPYWNQFRVAVDAERAAHSRALLSGGPHQLLGALGPVLRWRPPRLEAGPGGAAVALDGDGVTLLPSVFCDGEPFLVPVADSRPLLVYPMDEAARVGALAMIDNRVADPHGLRDLLGATRAAILVTLLDPSTTTEVARRKDLAPSTVSKHLSVLREAGLLDSRRLANEVLYFLTPLGRALVHSATSPDRDGDGRRCPKGNGTGCSPPSLSTTST
ncbi:hypothetical protein CIK06_17895 [Plantactinospora sp. KBS50]|nr:hypothetical protein CIK06_17895 [Plantactinospora sp. KBS50]